MLICYLGGVVGVSLTAYDPIEKSPIIGFILIMLEGNLIHAFFEGFDMGGTSTDVSRYDGHFEHVFDSVTAGIIVQAPQVRKCLIFLIILSVDSWKFIRLQRGEGRVFSSVKASLLLVRNLLDPIPVQSVTEKAAI